jgi:hypothetical protein
LKKTNNAHDDDDDGWFSCPEDEDGQEEEEVQRQEKRAPEEKAEADVEAATTFPPTVKPFALSMESTGAPQQEHVEEGEELQKLKAWLTNHRLGHVSDSLREMGVDSLEDLATDAEDDDVAQLLYNYRALRSTIEVRRFRRALQDLRISTEQGGGAVGPTPTPALPLKPHLGSPTSILRFPGSPMDLPTPSPSFSQVFKPTKEATPLDKKDVQLDFMSEVIENNKNARSDHEGGEAAHRQTPNERANNDPLDDKLRKILYVPSPCHPIQSMLPTFPPVLRLPAPFPPPTPTPAVSKPTKEATPTDKGNLQLDFTSEVTENNNARSDHGDEKLSHPQVFKAAKDATPPDKGKLDPDFRTEVIETNNNARRKPTETEPSAPAVFKPIKEATPPDMGNLQLDFMSEVTKNNNDARSDHGGGEAAHRQTPNERANNDPLDDKLRKILHVPSPCHPIQSKLPKFPPVSRLPAPFPPPTPTAN